MKKINWQQIGQWIWKRPGWACAPPGVPLRRDPKLFYVTQVVAGAASGVVLVNPALCLVPDLAGRQDAAILIGAIGIGTGWLTAHWFEPRYTAAWNGWPWLLGLAALQLILAPLAAIALTAVVGGILAAVALVVGLGILIIFLIALLFGGLFGG